MQLLRRYNLADQLERRPRRTAARSSKRSSRASPTARTNTRWPRSRTSPPRKRRVLPEMFHRGRALEFYGTSLVHAYRYLFDYKDELPLNAYDPQFRGASDLYNQSLEGMLRLVRQDGELRPGTDAHHPHVEPHLLIRRRDALHGLARRRLRPLRVRQRLPGAGPAESLSQLRPGRAADRRPPAARRRGPGRAILSAESQLPADGVLARLARSRTRAGPGRVAQRSVRRRRRWPENERNASRPTAAPRFVLELYDSLEQPTIDVAGRRVPLEADLTTPLAYFLNQPQFQDSKLSTDRPARTRARPRSCRASTCSSRTTRTRCRS